MRQMFRPSLNSLLILFRLACHVEHMHPESHTLIFGLSCYAIVPLAAVLGKATEQIADRAGENIGGFLNATLGNAAELIIAIVALKQGMIDVVQASLTGSIIGNVSACVGSSFPGRRNASQDAGVQRACGSVLGIFPDPRLDSAHRACDVPLLRPRGVESNLAQAQRDHFCHSARCLSAESFVSMSNSPGIVLRYPR